MLDKNMDMDMDWTDVASRTIPNLWSSTSSSSTSTPRAGGGIYGGGVIPTQSWNRSLSSLRAASQALLEQPGVLGAAGSSGGRMDIRSRFNKSPWTRPDGGGASVDNAAAETTTRTTTTTPASVKGIEETLAEYEEGVIQTLGREFEEAIDKDTNRETQEFLQNAWDRQHRQWLEEIGVGGGRIQNSSNDGGIRDSTNALNRTPVHSGYSSSGAGGGTGGGSGSSSRNSILPLQQHQQNRHFPSGQQRLDPHLIQAHGRVVQDLPRLTPDKAAHEFGLLVQQSSTSSENTTRGMLPASQPVMRGYVTAWNWMTHMLRYQQQQSQTMNTVDKAIATIIHLCHHFRNEIEQPIQAASASGQADLISDTYSNPIAKLCHAFAKLMVGPSVSSGGMPWPILYFCLRCGSAAAALEVWQTSTSLTQISDVVTESITELLQAMKPWEETAGPPQLPNEHLHIVADYLQSLSTLAENGGIGDDPSRPTVSLHQIGFLSLLSGTGSVPNDDSAHGFYNIEDFLFGHISNALLQRDPEEQLAQLGKLIQEYGVNYFGDAESGGWSYSLPLLMTQQYSKALTHLVEEGSNLGLLQAAHLGLLMSSSSIALSDLGQPEETEDLAASLLVAYASRLIAEPSAGSLAALEYLTLIPKRDRMRKEVATLIAKTCDLEKIVGKVDAEGVRYGGELLDRKFAKDEISALLGDAAEMLLRESHGDNAKMGLAAMCYMLAGRYDNVLGFLSEMLFPPDVYENNNGNNKSLENREFWMDQTRQFHQFYLDKRTRVLEVLERDGKMHLVQTTRLLMELNIFFQHLRRRQHSEAWKVADNTQLLPTDENDIHGKQELYRNGVDDTVKRSYPSFLVGVMECLFRKHNETKWQQQQMSKHQADSVASQHLQELQSYARLLVTFAGMLGIANNQLSQMEAMMV